MDNKLPISTKGHLNWSLVTLFINFGIFIGLAQGQRTPYACSITEVIQCGDTAIKDAIEHSCNWQKIIPKFDGCVYEATRGCLAVIQLEIDGWVKQLNTTIHHMNDGTAQTTVGCVHECLNDNLKKAEVDKCASAGTGLEALKQKIMAAQGTNQNMDAECKELHSIESCMLKQVGDCLDILKYINGTLDKVQWLELENICTTQHVWPNTKSATEDASAEKDDDGLDVEYVVIIVVAIVVLVAVNVVVCFVIYRERQRKEQAKLLRGSTTDDRSSDPVPPYSSPDGPYVNPGSPYINPGAYTGLYPSLHTGAKSPGFYGSRPPSYGGGAYGESPTMPYR